MVNYGFNKIIIENVKVDYGISVVNMDILFFSLDINKLNKLINMRIKRVFRLGKILKIKKKIVWENI